MSHSLRERLRLVFRTGPVGADENAGAGASSTALPWVQFVAFTEDCRVSGRVQLDSDRLSDTLNGHRDYLLCDVLVESLGDGRSIHADEVPVAREELLAVLTDGSRGDPSRRTHTLAHPVTVKAGPYLIRGNIHSLPGVEPLASARHRRPMIPLSDAWIEYGLGGTAQTAWCGTIVVNRETADWIQLGFARPGALANAGAEAVPPARGGAATEGPSPA